MSMDGAIWSIIQEAPTDWIRLPKFESRLAIQMPRKTGYLNGESAEGAPESFMGRAFWRDTARRFKSLRRGLEAPFVALYCFVRAFFEAPRERTPDFVSRRG